MAGLTLDEELRRLDVAAKMLGWSEDELRARKSVIAARYTKVPATQQQGDTRGNRQPPRNRTSPSPLPNVAPFQPDANLLVAPYRFVPLNRKILQPEPGCASPNLTEPLRGGYCATIEVEFECETPLLIGRDEGSPAVAVPLSLENASGGPWWVPGASLRGMLRAAAEIVGYARLDQTNSDHVFPLRDFRHPDYNAKAEGTGPSLGDATKIRAGWLRLDGDGTWRLHPARLAYIQIADMLGSVVRDLRDPRDWNRLKLKDKYRVLGGGDDATYAYWPPFKFVDTGLKKYEHPQLRPGGKAGEDWVIVAAGVSPPASPQFAKKWECAFKPFDASSQSFVVGEKIRRSFELVYSKPGRGDNRQPDGAWMILKPLFDGKTPIPVYFVGDPETQGVDFAMGLNRLFKLPHNLTQGKMIARTQGEAPADYQPDFVSNLFGYVVEGQEGHHDRALKSRIAVSGASISQDAAEVISDGGKPFETVMGQPRASFAPFYLAGTLKDWSAVHPDTEIAGRKRYIPRHETVGSQDMQQFIARARERFKAQIDNLTEEAGKNTDTRTRMKFLSGRNAAPFTFSHEIRLHNVTAAELGLVLWVLTFGVGGPGSACRHMLGRAKAYGFGQIRLAGLQLKVKGNDAESTQTTAADFMRAFEQVLHAQGIPDMRSQPEIKAFLSTANPLTGRALREWPDGRIYLPLTEHKKLRGDARQRHTVRRFITPEG